MTGHTCQNSKAILFGYKDEIYILYSRNHLKLILQNNRKHNHRMKKTDFTTRWKYVLNESSHSKLALENDNKGT